jgi:predicted DCC family thiol-disulfide oxidoreductase YuxK
MKKLDKEAQIQWVDITQDTDALANAGLTYRQAMDRIHVMDENAQLHSGVRGFLLVWKRLPYYRFLAKIIENVPFMLAIMEQFYCLFARYRLTLTGKKYLDEPK